jgi:hypothetical protein
MVMLQMAHHMIVSHARVHTLPHRFTCQTYGQLDFQLNGFLQPVHLTLTMISLAPLAQLGLKVDVAKSVLQAILAIQL